MNWKMEENKEAKLLLRALHKKKMSDFTLLMECTLIVNQELKNKLRQKSIIVLEILDGSFSFLYSLSFS